MQKPERDPEEIARLERLKEEQTALEEKIRQLEARLAAWRPGRYQHPLEQGELLTESNRQ
jgi:hypothetical protein